MEELAAKQTQIGKDIEKLASAYRNDKPERKTLSYLFDKLEAFNELWAKFEKNNEEIQNFYSTETEHQYFKTNYYNKVQDGYNTIKMDITSLIKCIDITKSPIKHATAINNEDNNESGGNVMPSIQDNGLIRLIRRQQSNIAALENILAGINLTLIQTKQYYQLKIDTIKQYWDQIRQINNEIWELTTETEVSAYETDGYFRLENRVQEFLILLTQELDKATNTNTSFSSATETQSSMRLPKVVLPKFDGDYLKWQQFNDLFTQMVHNQAMSSIQKMWYLKMNLSGEAEKLIRHLQLTESNYITAWEILKNRYENKRLLVSALLDKLIAQPAITNESSSALKMLHDTTKECLVSLQNLGLSVKDYWDPIIVHMLMKKLDKNTHALFEQSLTTPRDLQSIDKLLDFLEKRFQALEALGKKQNTNQPQQRSNKPSVFITNKQGNGILECMYCKKNHALYFCEKFLKLTPQERQIKARELNLCLNCLKKGHNYNKCPSRNCLKCNKRHNTLLHIPAYDQKNYEKTTNNQPSTSAPTNLAAQVKENQGGYVFLGTALVNTIDSEGKYVPCRILLDSGSQLNFITEKLRKKLKLANTHVNLNIAGIGDAKVKVSDRVTVTIKSKLNDYSTETEVYVIKEISAQQPQQYINIDNWQIPTNITLADPEFNKPQKIDILLGAELYGELMRTGQIRLNENLPLLQSTVLGWIVLGKVSFTEYNKPFCGLTNLELENQLQRFWEIEECPEKIIMSTSEQKCEEYFETTTYRNTNGRFIVNLPMLSDPCLLGESKELAFKRFLSIERRLMKEPSLKAQYDEFLNEYLKLGHMCEVKSENIRKPYYFLPHHFVLKPSSSTTKLRVVFDASAKTSDNLSLNDLMLKGPKIQDDLMSIILRFRTKKYVFTADIVKMYRQIIVAEEDRNLQLIMWRQNPSQPIKYYQLCTVTYGTKSAPYLAVKCLQKLAEEDQEYPLGAAAIRDFYVDDVMTGSNDLQEAINIQAQLQTLLGQAGFKLRKWCANHPKLVEGMKNEDLEIQLNFSDLDDEHIKTLGLAWHPITDLFSVTSTIKCYKNITKRTILAEMSQIFDPLGLVNPVVVMSKIFMQKLWKLKLDWDDELPLELNSTWLQFRGELSKLKDIKVTRYMFSGEPRYFTELHAFADASEKAYGAVLYIRSKDKKGQVMTKLLCAKSRVAPVKPTTLPRLELCAAKLAANLVNHVKTVMKLEFDETYYWTDSQIVISWIRGDASILKTFVANRVGAIQELTQKKEWRYIHTKENPADLVSRGMFPAQLVSCKLWFEGPEFLKLSKSKWPCTLHEQLRLPDEEKPVKLSLTIMNMAESHPMYSINHGNSFRKLNRVMAVILRAIRIFKKKPGHLNTPFLSVAELEEAHDVIIKEMQASSFKEEIKALQSNRQISKSSKLATLTPFIDKNGLLRVGGRLTAADISYNTKHPLVLPSDNIITKLILNYLHNTHLHAGPQALHAIVRQKYWILQGRNMTRSVITNCVTCARVKPKLGQQQMGNLPSNRVQKARPFLNCGVDFCGPVYTHFKIRGKRPLKTYIAVFCCFATKAIHLEVVSDLTTEGFLGALKRFIARRGMCENIYCDNATNFVGAENQLQEIQEMLSNKRSAEKIVNTCSDKNIQFHFIPPRSPHFGGLWEAAVKSTKYLLQRTLTTTAPTYEELCTMTAEAEAILNSRPLTPLSSDPNDLMALTPAHFLMGEPMTASINTHVKTTKMSLLSRWALVSHIRQEFWRRWSKEYLIELQRRAKWTDEYPNMKEGTLVIIKEENLPPFKWRLGRIDETIKGKDGKVRVADVKTSTGILRRAVHQLAPLPVELYEYEPYKQNEKDNETPSNDDDPESQRKSRKRKNSSTSLNTLKVLLLTALVLPSFSSAAPSQSSDPVQVQEFDHQAGIFFERLGQASIASNDWNLLAYYDLKGYWATINTIEKAFNQLNRLCKYINHNDYHTEIVRQYQHQFKEISENNMLISGQRSGEIKSRKGRSPLDIVGNIANKLFGLLDSDYATQMTETIDRVKTNEDHLNDLIRNQTLILETIINVIKKDEEERRNQTKLIEDSIELAYEKIRNMNTEMKQQRTTQVFNTLSILVASLLSECKFTQEAIIDVIIDTHHGRTNPLVISPTQLQSQISIIKSNLPAGTTLPSTNGEINLSLIYRMMRSHYRIINNYVIFGMHIPLVMADKFEMYHIVTLPTLINNTFTSIMPKMQYLITTLYRDQFYLLTQYEFTQCMQIKDDHYLCKQHRPTQKATPDNRICEIQLFLQQTISSTCAIKVESPHRYWSQLHAPNHWLFSLEHKCNIGFVCDNKLFYKTLKGSGMLTMNGDCTMRDNQLIIRTVNNIKTNVSLNSFQPRLNLTLHEENFTADTLPIFQHTILKSHNQELNNITRDLKNLKLHQTKLLQLQPHDVHQFTISYVTVGIIVVIVIYLATIRCRPHCEPAESSQADASKKNESKNDEYNFEVKDFNRGQDVHT